jgi:hypothetical protein
MEGTIILDHHHPARRDAQLHVVCGIILGCKAGVATLP